MSTTTKTFRPSLEHLEGRSLMAAGLFPILVPDLAGPAHAAPPITGPAAAVTPRIIIAIATPDHTPALVR